MSFWEEWVAASERNERSVTNTPVVARAADLQWAETPNDHKFAFLIAEQTGFPTQGSHLARAIIPIGQHTGRQRHGEEAVHILQGSGFVVVDGRRYNFLPGTTIYVPYMADHQLFNTGDEDVEYVTAATTDLDLYVKLGRLEQLEAKGTNEPGFESRFPPENGQLDAEGRRIALHLVDAPDENKRREELRRTHGGAHGHHGRHGAEGGHRHGAILILMGGGESPSEERNGFTAKAAAMTNIFEEVPHSSSHCHSHTEAMLYVLEGEGYSEIDGGRYDWRAGDAVHVPPKMTRHEHFNPSDARTRTLRIEFGIRYFYEDLWKGYHKIEHRLEAMARP